VSIGLMNNDAGAL